MSDFFRSSPKSARPKNDRPLPLQGLQGDEAESSASTRHPRGGEDPTSSENTPSATPAEAGAQRTSEILNEAILASSSSVRDSLPEQYRKHFETLRQEIIDFAEVHDIPRASLTKPNALAEAARKLSTPELTQLALLLECFEYLLVHKEPKKEETSLAEALEHAERLYHLKEQYTSQVSLLEQVGILKDGAILGIDGNIYPIPTLEQIAARIFERRETLRTKHDQGFTKLLLVPFGMSLDTLQETLKQFLLGYKKDHPIFDLDTNEPLWTWSDYQRADIGDSPKLVYHPQSFTQQGHGGKTKMEILKTNYKLPTPIPTQSPLPGWTIHLLQPSDPSDLHSPGFASIPRRGQGTLQGDENPRFPLEANKTPNEYLSILKKAQDNPNHPYSQESGMTPEDWIIAFITHLTEMGKPLDDSLNLINTECYCQLIGAFFHFSAFVPGACWSRDSRQAGLYWNGPRVRCDSAGARSSVMI